VRFRPFSAGAMEPGLTRLGRLRTRAAIWTTPTVDDLPNAKVLFAFPVVLLVLLAVLVTLGITGSSTGILNQFFSNTPDAALVAGHPQGIRSDEWMVQTPLVISQVEQGLPLYNQGFPGGIDSTVQSDLPSRDWSIAFRPHLVGFWFLPLDNAMSLRWWLPPFAMIAACYAFFVTMRPRRPLTAAILATGFFCAPFFQWWFLPITFWPVAWSFLVMTSAVWLLRSHRVVPKVVLMAVVAYLTVTVAIGVYVPFMIPALLIAAAFVVGVLFTRSDDPRETCLLRRFRSLLPLLIAGLAGGVVVAVWVFTRLDTIGRFLGTLYPGQRLTEPGSSTFRQVLSLMAAPFSKNLGVDVAMPLDANPSEGSSFFMMGLFLIVPLVWMAWRKWRSTRRVDWLVVSLMVFLVVIAAYLVLPGWGVISHLLLLDRTTAARVRPGLGILTIVVVAVYAVYVDERKVGGARVPLPLIAVTSALGAVTTAALALVLGLRHVSLVTVGLAWVPIALIFIALILLLARGNFVAGAAAFLAVSVAVAGTVNPVYVGVYDLNSTALVRYMKTLDASKGSEWVGVGTILPTAALQQSGLHSYSGFQSAPSPTMWAQIDPSNTYEAVWNRLANVRWVEGAGSPIPRAPQADVILLNFDACAPFARAHVNYVLSDSELTSTCVGLVREIQQGPRTFWIYRVAH